ncbi:MAG: DUF4402 domain-containing protein [Bacteroidales bacterium]|nr:DUF4402 domain-containing protein [Bacteroidales bacterium]
MRRLIPRTISLFLLLLASAYAAEAQPGVSSTVTGHITAEVISTLSAVETSQLSFGKFSPGPQGGSLILNPENTISVVGSVWPGSGSHSAASFYVTGDPGFPIRFPACVTGDHNTSAVPEP